jgi:hypothetical protein
MRRCRVFRSPTAHPADTSALSALVADALPLSSPMGTQAAYGRMSVTLLRVGPSSRLAHDL